MPTGVGGCQWVEYKTGLSSFPELAVSSVAESGACTKSYTYTFSA